VEVLDESAQAHELYDKGSDTDDEHGEPDEKDQVESEEERGTNVDPSSTRTKKKKAQVTPGRTVITADGNLDEDEEEGERRVRQRTEEKPQAAQVRVRLLGLEPPAAAVTFGPEPRAHLGDFGNWMSSIKLTEKDGGRFYNQAGKLIGRVHTVRLTQLQIDCYQHADDKCKSWLTVTDETFELGMRDITWWLAVGTQFGHQDHQGLMFDLKVRWKMKPRAARVGTVSLPTSFGSVEEALALRREAPPSSSSSSSSSSSRQPS
jgi:hypothetical protein